MKRIHLTFICAVIAQISYAQTQQGLVRTVGTSTAHGKPIANATVKLKGNTNSVVSDNRGKFALPMTGIKEGAAYQLLNVIKSGYEFADRNFLSKKFAYSSMTPLEVVMISTAELNRARQDMENRTYRNIQAGFDKKVAALEAELKARSVTTAAYRKKLKELQDQFDNIDAIVTEMAEHYVRTDYDKLDSLDAVINSCIMNGELDRADLLIAQKGSLEDRIAAYQRHASSNQEARAMLDKLTEDLAQQRVLYVKEREDIANDLYNKYFIAVSQFDNDKAYENLELRAALDTTNVDWQLDFVEFVAYNYTDFEKVKQFSERALRHAIAQYGENSLPAARSYNWLGNYYLMTDRTEEAEYYHNATLKIRKDFNDVEGIARSCMNMCVVYSNKKLYGKALEYISEARKHCLSAAEPNKNLLVAFYLNEGSIHEKSKETAKAAECYRKGLAMYEHEKLQDPNTIIGLYNGLGNITSDVDSSINYYKKALSIMLETKRTNDVTRLKLFQNINNRLRLDSANVDMVIASYRELIPQEEAIYGNNHRDVALSWATFGHVLIGRGMIDEAESYCQRAYDFYAVRQDTLTMAKVLSDLGFIRSSQNQNEEAMEMFEKSETYYKLSGTTPSSSFYMNHAAVYYQLEKYNKAAEYYIIAHTRGKEENIDKADIATYAQYVAETYEKASDILRAIQWHINAAAEFHEAGYDNFIGELKKAAGLCYDTADWLMSQNDTLTAARYFGMGADCYYRAGDGRWAYEGAYRAAFVYQQNKDKEQARIFYNLGINACEQMKGAMKAEEATLCNSAAYMCILANDFDRAMAYQDKAISLNPNDANLYDSKGEILLMQGKNDEALTMWKKVLELNPNFLDNYPDGTNLSNGLQKIGLIK